MINQYAYSREIYDDNTGEWYEPEVPDWLYWDRVALSRHLQEWLRNNARSYRHAESITGIDHVTLWRVANYHDCEWATCMNVVKAIELDKASYMAIFGTELGTAHHQRHNDVVKVTVL